MVHYSEVITIPLDEQAEPNTTRGTLHFSEKTDYTFRARSGLV